MAGKVLAVTCNPCIDKTITIEKLIPYGLNRVVDARLDPGGKGINVAKVLRNFGVDVTVTGFVAGRQGQLLIDFLKSERIDYDFSEIAGETRTNLKVIDRQAKKTTEINESGCPVDAAALAGFKARLNRLLPTVSAAVFSGSLPPGVPAGFYAECIQNAKKAGAKTLLDADGDALMEGLKSVPYAVKPNIHELEAYCGRSLTGISEIASAARSLIRQGVEIVIVSMGPDGAVVADRNEIYKVDSWDIRVLSPIGAGDSMVAALASSILRGDSLYDIAKITTAAGTITASKAGTEICTLPEVLDNLDHVAVKRMEIPEIF